MREKKITSTDNFQKMALFYFWAKLLTWFLVIFWYDDFVPNDSRLFVKWTWSQQFAVLFIGHDNGIFWKLW